MAQLERTVYNALTQVANSTIIRTPGSNAIQSGVIDIFFPDVRLGRVKYRLTDSTGKVTDFDVDKPWETAEGIKVTLRPEGITPGHQFATVECTGDVGLLLLSVVLNDWPDKTSAGVEARLAALEAKEA